VVEPAVVVETAVVVVETAVVVVETAVVEAIVVWSTVDEPF